MADEQDFSASLELSPEQLEAGRLLFAGPCDFFYGAQQIGQLPDPAAPEVAFAGRSNVGKSSLINALTGRKSLARASSEPGRTKQDHAPQIGATAEIIEHHPLPVFLHCLGRLGEAIARHVHENELTIEIKKIELLLDARIETKASDRDVMDMFDKAAINFQVVLTKCDDVKPKAEEARYREVVAEVSRHPAAHPLVLRTSSETGLGIPELRAEIAAFAEPVQN